MCRADFKNDENSLVIDASDVVTELNGYDVLLGRSVPKWKCPGNGIFRRLIASHGDEYRSSNKHAYKDEIARRILLTIRALGGRFLRQIESKRVQKILNIDADTEAWVAVAEETGLLKIKQALRDLPYNVKSPKVPTLARQNPEPILKMFATENCMPIDGNRLPVDLYSPSIPLNEKCLYANVGNVASCVPFRKRQTTKLDDIISAYRKKEYLRVHNLTISTQLRLLGQHQRPRVNHIMKHRRYLQVPMRRKTRSPNLTAMTGSLKNVYVR
jgi:hypothetical protein